MRAAKDQANPGVCADMPEHSLLTFAIRTKCSVDSFFAGNFRLFIITSQGHHELRVDLEDWEGNTRFAKYRIFNIGHPTELYNLTALGYTGDAGNHITKCVISDVIRGCVELSSRTSCLFFWSVVVLVNTRSNIFCNTVRL